MWHTLGGLGKRTDSSKLSIMVVGRVEPGLESVLR